ncbi:MAG: zinc-binding dehydrogenase [Lentisphaeria bacterium]|nr:zinc-binding dehydrogenase [Lentisphaeria bacterium]
MRALVKYGNRPRQVEIREVPVPEIGAGDVLLATRAVGVCGWDLEMWQHTMANPVTVPVIQGHEFCGVIAAVGAAVRGWRVGDRVVSETSAVICGACPQCRTGNYQFCPDRKGFGYGVDGAFTDYVRVREGCLHRLPDNVSFDHGALTEPACVAYQSVAVLSRVLPGTPALILGPGPIGLFCLQMARAQGAGPLIVAGTGRRPERLEAARILGADAIIDISRDDPVSTVMAMTGGRGVPLVVDAAGNEKALAVALRTVARQGQITKVGWGPEPVGLSLDPLLSKAARLQGTFSHNWPIWEAVLAMVAQGTLRLEPMISHRCRLEDWESVFSDLESGRGIKAVMQFHPEEPARGVGTGEPRRDTNPHE